MEFLYCFENASLTQRTLVYLQTKWRSHIEFVTVIFLNDRWVVRLKLDSSSDAEQCENCWAFLNENGLPYHPPSAIAYALKDLDEGNAPTAVMNRHNVVIVSHGMPKPGEIKCFRKQFVAGLGYCPQSLV